jgi:hypothetical protein
MKITLNFHVLGDIKLKILEYTKFNFHVSYTHQYYQGATITKFYFY